MQHLLSIRLAKPLEYLKKNWMLRWLFQLVRLRCEHFQIVHD
jgi:hypothetical protein